MWAAGPIRSILGLQGMFFADKFKNFKGLTTIEPIANKDDEGFSESELSERSVKKYDSEKNMKAFLKFREVYGLDGQNPLEKEATSKGEYLKLGRKYPDFEAWEQEHVRSAVNSRPSSVAKQPRNKSGAKL